MENMTSTARVVLVAGGLGGLVVPPALSPPTDDERQKNGQKALREISSARASGRPCGGPGPKLPFGLGICKTFCKKVVAAAATVQID
jgi:hypothetical protein